jgi:hypothetical protein
MRSKYDQPGWFQDEESRRDNRYVDMELVFVRHGSQEYLASYGGKWDRKFKRFVDDAANVRVIEVHAQQISAVEIFDDWIRAKLAPAENTDDLRARVRELFEEEGDLADEDRAIVDACTELFLSGGRRSGKTFTMYALGIACAVAVPQSIINVYAPTEELFFEIQRDIFSVPAASWYKFDKEELTITFVNGSVITIISAHKPGNAKRGKADMSLVNEAQQIKAESYRNIRGAAIDDGSMTICALNPPTLGDIGEWTSDAVAKADAGRRMGARHLFVDPLDNPHINLQTLLAMRDTMTEHDFDTQIRGKFLSHPGSVLYSWSRSENERTTPQLGECTREFVTAHEGDRTAWQSIVVVDVQVFPYIALGIFKAFRDPRKPHDPKHALLWGTNELAMFPADEHDVCLKLLTMVDPKRTLVIMDASCFWQQMQRDPMKQRPEYRAVGDKPVGSATIFKAMGFPHVVYPDRRMKGNPGVIERIRATQMAVKPQGGIRTLYVDPTKCPNMIESAKNWRMKHGKPSRSQNAAHFGDVLGYLVWRFFPRRGTARNIVDEALAVNGEA